jgi:hypothetical protein
MKRIKKYFYAPLLGLFFLLPVNAATITVTNTNNTGPGSLRETIVSAAASGDTIVFNLSGCPCIIRLTSGQITINKNVTINGPGAGMLTVSGEDASRVFNITGPAAVGTITLSGLTISNGRLGSAGLSFGAGIYNTSPGTLNINDSVITTNSIAGINNPAAGAGIAHETAGTLNINDSAITNNTLSTNANSSATSGAGLANLLSGTVNLSSVDITGNQATHGGLHVNFYGGALFNADSGAFNLTGCNVLNNTLTNTASNAVPNIAGGAGMANLAAGPVTIANSTFDNNVATGNSRAHGGGLVNVGSAAVTIDRSTFSDNRAVVTATGVEASGGGVAAFGTGNLNVSETTFANNGVTAENASGGGLANLNTGTTTVSSSAFSGNFTDSTASGRNSNGGAIDNSGGGTLNLTNCTIVNNSTIGRRLAGGGVANRGPAGTVLNLINCTIAGNTSDDGGGVYSDRPGNTAINTIIANNTASSGPDVFGAFNGGVAFGHNFVGRANGSTGFTNGVNGNQSGSIAVPLNPLLGTLADNGGLTLTMSLQPGSPAIDKGRAAVTSDQRGVTRPMDNTAIPPATGGNNSDIGAFEVDVCGTGTTVSNTNDSGSGSLRCAIDSATSGDTIDFSLPTPATIILLTELLVNKSVTINGPGAGLLTVNGNNSVRVFNIAAGNYHVTFANLTISGGRVIGSLTALERGAGVLNQSRGTVSLNTTVVSGNTVSNSTPQGDSVNGAGISHVGGGTLNLFATTVSGNLADGNFFAALGGGIYADSGTVAIRSSTLSGNNATSSGDFGNGGGFYCTGTCSATVVNSTFSGNVALGTTSLGAGFYADSSGTKTVVNCTFTLNGGSVGTRLGSGIYHNSPSAVFNVKNSIIAANIGLSGRQDVSGAFVSDGFNFIGANGGAGSATGFIDGLNGDQVGPAGSPRNPLLGPLADNGGPTLTHRLMPNSQAIDRGGAADLSRIVPVFQSKIKGSRQRPSGSVNTDQRGVTRPIDFPLTPNAMGGDGSDIGSYEIQAPTAAHVSISGRVITSDGRGLRNAFVHLMDAAGNVRSARTSSFGYFTIEDVEVGQAYVLTLSSKRYFMQPRIINLSDELADLELIVQPRQP